MQVLNGQRNTQPQSDPERALLTELDLALERSRQRLHDLRIGDEEHEIVNQGSNQATGANNEGHNRHEGRGNCDMK